MTNEEIRALAKLHARDFWKLSPEYRDATHLEAWLERVIKAALSQRRELPLNCEAL